MLERQSKCFASVLIVMGALTVLCCATAWAGDTARYLLTVRVDWNAVDHPAEFPESPHWSRLIAASHSSRYRLFADGETASTGVALMATNGRPGVVLAELAEGRRRGRVGEHAIIDGLRTGTGAFETTLEVSPTSAFVSFVTMLAPSPDWFTGAASVRLRGESGAWRKRVSVPLWVWDAGADSGNTFIAPDVETQPRQSVSLLTHPAFLHPAGLKPIGEATFALVD